MNCFTVPQKKKKEGLILNFSCHKRTAVIGCEAGGGGEGEEGWEGHQTVDSAFSC